jgi:hypothetical protein
MDRASGVLAQQGIAPNGWAALGGWTTAQGDREGMDFARSVNFCWISGFLPELMNFCRLG